MSQFCLQSQDPEVYRSRTRKSSLVIIGVFAVLGMGCASLLVAWLGAPGGNNFRWNLAGVLCGLFFTYLLVRYWLSHQPFMAEAVYGWHLKRNLMRITNQMHRIRPLAEANDLLALKVLRFYHLAVDQMHRLDGNEAGLLEIKAEKQRLEAQLDRLGMSKDQTCINKEWIKELTDKTVEA